MEIASNVYRPGLGLLVTALALAQATPASAAPACGTENLLGGRAPIEAAGVSNNLGRLTDGVVGDEGAQWNAPVVVELATTSAFVTFDLGEPREISAAYVQADSNDVYELSGSVDGAPGTFAPLATFPNAAAAGHGLRGRAIDVAPKTVRFVRLGQPAGDSFFSVAELGAYCKRPAPFPPPLRVDSAAAPGDGVAAEARRHRGGFLGRYGAALVALVWLAYLVFRSADKRGASVG